MNKNRRVKGMNPMDRSDGRKSFSIDTAGMAWEERPNAKIGRSLYRKKLIEDYDTGMKINLLKYPAGFVTPLHRHPCAHGIYVLKGTLKTDGGTFGPGSFIWYAQGDAAEHGATAQSDVVVMFITNKAFDIEYL
jgi:quercetin dioxygenase-like cupin family protein